MLKLLVDTCVWLDIAKDYRQQPVISALQDLLQSREVGLVVPEIVIDEFARNKDRVAAEARRSLQSHFKLVREAVDRFGEEEYKAATLAALGEVDQRIAMKGEAVNDSISLIESFLSSGVRMETTKAIKERVTERAIAGAAPYHRSRNSVGDAILVETYAQLVKDRRGRKERLAFVTHNTRDFSEAGADQRNPHPDLAGLFDGTDSTYWVSLVDLLKSVDTELLADYDSEFSWTQEPRRLSEILEAEHLLYRQIWYNRHRNLRIRIQRGEHHISSAENSPAKPSYRQDQTLDTVWELAVDAAKRTEDEVGVENLGPWDDFEWGMLNGKLSALRWVLGDEWDMLDT